MMSTYAFFYCVTLFISVVIKDTVNSQTCGLRPTTSRYRGGSLINPASPTAECSSTSDSGEVFTVCTESAITNTECGPENFTSAVSNDYFMWASTGGEVEFAFSQNISFTRIIFHFYFNRNPDLALPKIRILGSSGGGNFPSCSASITSGVIDMTLDKVNLLANPSLRKDERELALIERTTDGLKLCVQTAKDYMFALTEIQFCTNDVLEPPITESVITVPLRTAMGNTPQPGISQPSPPPSGTLQLQTQTSAGVVTINSVLGREEIVRTSGAEIGAAPTGTAMYMSILLATMLIRLLHGLCQVTPFD